MLIRLRQPDLVEAGIPTCVNTLRDWRLRGKFKEVFVKIGGTVYVNTAKFQKIIKGVTNQ